LDRGLWITWYDLQENARDAYLSWLHGTYVPRQLARPGFLWAAHYASEEKIVYSGEKGRLKHAAAGSVPAGTRFILLFGAEDVAVFTNPMPGELHAGLPQEDRKMLAARVGERANIMLEQARVNGPEEKQHDHGSALSPCIQLGSFNAGSAPGDEENLIGWYAQCRLPLMTEMPGSVRTRKLVSACGWAKHAILYEFVSVAARNEHFLDYEGRMYPESAKWSDRIVRTVLHAPGSPSVAHRIWSQVKR
jgi:hypothetical protein